MCPICFYRINVAKPGCPIEDQQPGHRRAADPELAAWTHGTKVVPESDIAVRNGAALASPQVK